MPSDRVSQPWSVQVELVEGCTRLCTFCGLNGIRTAPAQNYKCMTKELALTAAKQCADLAPGARYEFAMHGEPTVHPCLYELLGIFRTALPLTQLMLTTNGARFKHNMERELQVMFQFVDLVVMDTYAPERMQLQAQAKAITDPSITVLDFYDDCAPKGWSPWHNHRRSVRNTLVVMDDLEARDKQVHSRTIYNHAGNARFKPPLSAPLDKTCTIPFRELNLTWNGDVNICCMDWGHEFVAGNITKNSLKEIWWGECMEAARRVLYQRRRPFSPCNRCDAGSGSRAGLLPHYRKPDAGDMGTLAAVMADSKPTNGFTPTIDQEAIAAVAEFKLGR